MRGLLCSTECETRKKYHLTGGPPLGGQKQTPSFLSTWKLEAGDGSLLPSVRTVRLLSTTLLLCCSLSAGDPPPASHRLSEQLGKTLAPGLLLPNLPVCQSLHAGSAVSTVRSAAGTGNAASV